MQLVGYGAGPGISGIDVDGGPGVIDASTWLATSNLNGACATDPGTPTITQVFAGPSPDPSPISVFVALTRGCNGGSPITTYSATCVSVKPDRNPVRPNRLVSARSPIFVGGLAKGGYQCTVT